MQDAEEQNNNGETVIEVREADDLQMQSEPGSTKE